MFLHWESWVVSLPLVPTETLLSWSQATHTVLQIPPITNCSSNTWSPVCHNLEAFSPGISVPINRVRIKWLFLPWSEWRRRYANFLSAVIHLLLIAVNILCLRCGCAWLRGNGGGARLWSRGYVAHLAQNRQRLRLWLTSQTPTMRSYHSLCLTMSS